MTDDDQDMGLAANALDAVGRIWNEEADPRDIARRVSNLVKPWREVRSAPGLVGRDCWFRFFLSHTKEFSDWFRGAWLAWSTESAMHGKLNPVALIEMETGEVAVTLAEYVRFTPPQKPEAV